MPEYVAKPCVDCCEPAICSACTDTPPEWIRIAITGDIAAYVATFTDMAGYTAGTRACIQAALESLDGEIIPLDRAYNGLAADFDYCNYGLGRSYYCTGPFGGFRFLNLTVAWLNVFGGIALLGLNSIDTFTGLDIAPVQNTAWEYDPATFDPVNCAEHLLTTPEDYPNSGGTGPAELHALEFAITQVGPPAVEYVYSTSPIEDYAPTGFCGVQAVVLTLAGFTETANWGDIDGIETFDPADDGYSCSVFFLNKNETKFHVINDENYTANYRIKFSYNQGVNESHICCTFGHVSTSYWHHSKTGKYEVGETVQLTLVGYTGGTAPTGTVSVTV